jgi:HK97 family phage prohead protease
MPTDQIERRQMLAEGLEVRQADNGAPLITGYAVVFGAWSRTLYDLTGKPFIERFDAGAFDGWLRSNPELVALWNHNADYPLARRSRGTLRIAKDATGLRFELDPPANTWGQDALVAIQRGDVHGMSFLFEQSRDAWGRPGADGLAQRTVLESVLHEISPVTFPAYPATAVQVRASVPDFPNPDRQEGATHTATDDRAVAEHNQLDHRQWAALQEVRRRRLALYRRLGA